MARKTMEPLVVSEAARSKTSAVPTHAINPTAVFAHKTTLLERVGGGVATLEAKAVAAAVGSIMLLFGISGDAKAQEIKKPAEPTKMAQKTGPAIAKAPAPGATVEEWTQFGENKKKQPQVNFNPPQTGEKPLEIPLSELTKLDNDTRQKYKCDYGEGGKPLWWADITNISLPDGTRASVLVHIGMMPPAGTLVQAIDVWHDGKPIGTLPLDALKAKYVTVLVEVYPSKYKERGTAVDVTVIPTDTPGGKVEDVKDGIRGAFSTFFTGWGAITPWRYFTIDQNH